MKSKHFARNFKPIVQLKPGEMCSWKRHYRGALRELIGILNLWASNDPEHFVYAGLDEMVRHCKRYKGKGYSRRQVLYALKELREREIVSKPVTRFRFGQEIIGVIVVAHDMLVTRHHDCFCVFHGFEVPQTALPTAPHIALPTAPQIALQTAPKTAPSVSPQEIDDVEGSDQKRALNRGSLSTAQTAQTVPTHPTPLTSAAKNGGGMERNGLDSSSASSSQSFTAEELKLWEEMIYHDDFPEEMIGARPRKDKDEQRRVIEQLKKYGVEVVVQAIYTWVENRDMGLDGLVTRWRAWLEEGGPYLRREAEKP